MAIDYRNQPRYNGKIDVTDLANYPQGKARNVSTPGDNTGTPWDQIGLNDEWGFLQSILARANVMPNNMPDSVGNPQYLNALLTLLAPPLGSLQDTRVVLSAPQWLLANGQAVSRTTYASLFALLGTTFGAGDGSTTFNLPADGAGRPVGQQFVNLGTATGLPAYNSEARFARAPNGNMYFVATGPSRMYRSTDNGLTWTDTNIGSGLPTTFDNPAIVVGVNNYVYFIDRMNGDLRRSTDNGVTFTNVGVGTGLPSGIGAPFLASAPTTSGSNPEILYFIDSALDTLYVSTNQGVNWTSLGVGDGLPANGLGEMIGAPDGYFYGIDIVGDQLYRLTPPSTTWTSTGLGEGLPSTISAPSMTVTPDGTLYFIDGTDRDRLYRSTDRGVTWSSQFLGEGLPDGGNPSLGSAGNGNLFYIEPESDALYGSLSNATHVAGQLATYIRAQ
ncbi:putative tail-fiber protein [Vibrio phage VP16T]|nr:putative tail-fiber protein [Vibrio phage VP16T]